MSAQAQAADLGVRFASQRLEQVFAGCFAAGEKTRLVGGALEPLYLPADAGQPESRLFYREDFFASALHETAHWCIAGAKRRAQKDFGYWYAPEGRGPAEQQAFLRVEARPQALEWCFSAACGYDFRLSLDNLATPENRDQAAGFAHRVVAEAQRLQRDGLPGRAARFFDALAREFGTGVGIGDLTFEPAGCRW